MTDALKSPAADLLTANAQVQAQSKAAGQRGGSEARMREAAESFEAVFISSMLENMSAGLKSDETFGGGQAEAMHRSMLNEEYGKQIVKRGGIGVSEAIFREMLRMQEAKP